MINWWLSLLFEQQVYMAVALASTLVLLVQLVLVLINFYGTDKLTADSDNLEQYEIVANYDSDMSQNKPKLISIISINLFLCVFSWTSFILTYKIPKVEQIVVSLILAVFVAVVYSIFRRLIKKYLSRAN